MYKSIPILLLLSGCTIVSVDLNAGTAEVATFATSRQDVVITRSADGSISWATKESSADTAALTNLSTVIAKLVGAAVVP